MAVHNYGKYVVVRTFNFDPNDTDKYKCILNTWIENKVENSDEISFGYPVEDSLDTLLRILKSETLDKSWPMRYGEVIFDSDCQDKVWYFLRLQHREERTTEQQEIENEKDSKKSSIPKKGTKTKTSLLTANRRRDKQKQINNKKKVIKKIKPKLSKNVLKNINSNLSNRSSLPSMSKSNSNSQELKKIPDENDNNRETREQSEQECDTSAQETAAVGDTSGHESVVIADTSKQEETIENTSISNGKQNVNISNTEIHSCCTDFYEHLNESYQKTMSHFDKIADNLKQIILANVNKAKKKPAKMSKKRPKREVLFEDRNIGTLRYTKLEPGIVELVPNSGVYVSEKELTECQSRDDVDTSWFAKILLISIFNDEAIMECNFSPSSNKNPRAKPALDWHARKVLLDYTIQYGKTRGWRPISRQRLIKCLNRRLSYIREKTNEYYDCQDDLCSSDNT